MVERISRYSPAIFFIDTIPDGIMDIEVGMGADEAEIPITLLAVKELAAKGACRYGVGEHFIEPFLFL